MDITLKGFAILNLIYIIHFVGLQGSRPADLCSSHCANLERRSLRLTVSNPVLSCSSSAVNTRS